MKIETSHGEIYCAVHGPKNGVPVVFTHGMGLNHRSFDAQVKRLKPSYRVVVWDLPGHGLSKETGPFTFKKAADAFEAMLDELALDGVFHVGVSLGGFVGQYIAMHRPGRIHGLIDIGSMPLYGSMSPFKAKMGSFFMHFIKVLTNKRMAKMFAKKNSVKAPVREYLYKQAFKSGKQRFIETSKEIFRELPKPIERSIDVPWFMIHGERERKMLIEATDKNAPEARRLTVVNAAHLPNQDAPKAVNEAILDFLGKNT